MQTTESLKEVWAFFPRVASLRTVSSELHSHRAQHPASGVLGALRRGSLSPDSSCSFKHGLDKALLKKKTVLDFIIFNKQERKVLNHLVPLKRAVVVMAFHNEL